MQVFFSVIIPVYNRKHLIKPVIDSVLQQSYSYFEVLIIDDGSSDNIEEFIAKEYTDERVKYFYKVNGERGAARNFGLEKAKGNYAVFLDSDDLMESFYLSTLFEIIKEYPTQGFFAAKYNFILPNGKQVPSTINSLKEGFYDFKFFLQGNVLACNFCIKLFDFDYIKFPAERELASMEDWLFVLLNTKNNPIFIKDIVCVHMQEHEGRSMAQNNVVIKARKSATEWILKNITLSSSEKKKLRTWSHYFCGVHEYLDNNRRQAINESINVIKMGGVKREFLLLFFKSLIGRKLIRNYK